MVTDELSRGMTELNPAAPLGCFTFSVSVIFLTTAHFNKKFIVPQCVENIKYRRRCTKPAEESNKPHSGPSAAVPAKQLWCC
jgi:hypothetical protein